MSEPTDPVNPIYGFKCPTCGRKFLPPAYIECHCYGFDSPVHPERPSLNRRDERCPDCRLREKEERREAGYGLPELTPEDLKEKARYEDFRAAEASFASLRARDQKKNE